MQEIVIQKNIFLKKEQIINPRWKENITEW